MFNNHIVLCTITQYTVLCVYVICNGCILSEVRHNLGILPYARTCSLHTITQDAFNSRINRTSYLFFQLLLYPCKSSYPERHATSCTYEYQISINSVINFIMLIYFVEYNLFLLTTQHSCTSWKGMYTPTYRGAFRGYTMSSTIHKQPEAHVYYYRSTNRYSRIL